MGGIRQEGTGKAKEEEGRVEVVEGMEKRSISGISVMEYPNTQYPE